MLQTKAKVEEFNIALAPKEFLQWIQELCDNGLRYEIVVSSHRVSHVYVSEVDDGHWEELHDEKSFRLIGSSEMKVRQKVYRPRIVNGKFIRNFND